MTPLQKTSWHGTILAVQPRIRLLRSFDERHHRYLGYVLWLDGTVKDEKRQFSIAIGRAAHKKFSFKPSDELSGQSEPVKDPQMELAEFYKTSRIKVLTRAQPEQLSLVFPPFLGLAPDLEIYRERGHRRLATRTYESKCARCMWACRMPVEMTIDQWNPLVKQYRFETFCYGPKSCPLYVPGPNRRVPGRKGMVYVEEDWVDEDATACTGSATPRRTSDRPGSPLISAPMRRSARRTTRAPAMTAVTWPPTTPRRLLRGEGAA